jgi:hypothetical protein
VLGLGHSLAVYDLVQTEPYTYSRVFATVGTIESVAALSLEHVSTIHEIYIVENKPASTGIKYAISFDGGTTWRVPSGQITNIATQGVDSATMMGYNFTGFTGDSLDVQAYLTSTNTSVTPSIDKIMVSLTIGGHYEQVTAEDLNIVESGTDNVILTNNESSTQTYQIRVDL